MHRWQAGSLLPLLLVALVLEPRWIGACLALPAWLGGFWRTWLMPLAVVSWLVIVVTNATSTGEVWRGAWRLTRRFGRVLPAALAFVLGVVAVALGANTLTGTSALRVLALLGLQLALYSWTPALLLLGVSAAWVAWLDRRGVSALTVVARFGCAAAPRLRLALNRVSPPLLAAVLAGAFASALFPDAMRGWARADGPDAQSFNLFRSFFNYSIYEDDRLERRSGFRLGLRGLTLPPGQEGEIVFRLERPVDSIVLLRTDFYNRRLAESGSSLTDETFPNRLELSPGPAQPFQLLVANTSLGEIVDPRVLDLTSLIGDSRTFRLRFHAHNTTPGEVTVLPAFSISTVVDPQTVPHPAFPVVVYSAIAASAVCAFVRARGVAMVPAATSGWVVGAVIALVAVGAARLATSIGRAATLAVNDLTFNPYNPPDVECALLAARTSSLVLAFCLVAWNRRLRALSPRVAPVWLVVACLFVVGVALDARWQELMRVRHELLLPDAAGYQAIGAEFPLKMARYRSERPSEILDALFESGYDGKANALAVFYAGGNNGREPGWPAILRLTYNLLGVSAFHTRLTSLLIASLTAGATCWLGWRALHPLIGFSAGLLYALNYPQIVNSVGGLREEAVGLFFVALVAALFVGDGVASPSPRRLASIGLAGAAMILIRADMLVLVGLLLVTAGLIWRWRLRRWLLAGALCGALSGPMYVGYAFTHRDPFHPGTYGATVNRNLEFPERMGTPGFPTADEYAANWAAGPRISPTTYFFGYHTIQQFVEYSVRGFVRIFPTILFRDQPVALWLFVAGAGLLLFSRRWLVPAIIVLSLAPFYAFMAGVPNPWVFAPRYAHHTLPFAVLAASYAIWFVPLWLARRRSSQATRRAQSIPLSDWRTA